MPPKKKGKKGKKAQQSNQKRGKNVKGKGKGKGKGQQTSNEQTKKKTKNAFSVKVSHILCQKQSKLLEAVEKLNQGKTFSEVARAYSEDKAKQGGNLGFQTRQSLNAKFAEVAFSLPLRTVSQPFKTPFGWHVCYVEAKK
ncbi:peptidyl-prolyl cis-trans isomerase nima-interacting 4 [Anaeramoeba flamelloides]|uniref:Peptidyl-prolyl cis-trans isomerase n=1 Tax=Anaeramoeba flamelloides TaxID=1746091 RepID=A0ABQ8Y0F3_9EUKA|nr:peptidyl-prolyl cis-trans isomerase nima-interacting 4 [Anaeramoeba flamelloides]KAJ6237164.1 peptidyl-prolyl cis-trans isomerase nima-interacting 4 [Anaeramoeba flamelloides]